jgi:hypothetical protein
MSLTRREIDLIEKIGQCMSEYRELLCDDGPDYYDTQSFRGDTTGISEKVRDDDINEFVEAVHVLQRMVMSRCAQRCHPNKFFRRPK